MPVYKLLEEMSYEEYSKWILYFEQRPLDWRDDLRFATILAALGDKRKPAQMFHSLNVIINPPNRDSSAQNIKSLKASSLFAKMMSAKGGEKLSILDEL